MAETNRLLCEDVPKHTFVALSYALLSPNGGQICLSNGGQLDPFLAPAAGDRPVRLVDTGGCRLPLGILPAVDYDETVVQLAPGDLLVLLSDGKDETASGFGPGSLHTLDEALNQALCEFSAHVRAQQVGLVVAAQHRIFRAELDAQCAHPLRWHQCLAVAREQAETQ